MKLVIACLCPSSLLIAPWLEFGQLGPKVDASCAQIDKNVEREILNHRCLYHPNIIRFMEVSPLPFASSSCYHPFQSFEVSSCPLLSFLMHPNFSCILQLMTYALIRALSLSSFQRISAS